MGFQTPQYSLPKYLDRVTSGEYQLPDFQRSYKWDEDRVKDLLVTVLRGHPMGVLMLLNAGNDQVRFKPRPIEGVVLDNHVEPKALILDGQQRLTSLTQALTGEGIVHTKDDRGKLFDRKYFVHMETALGGEADMADAVWVVPADGVIRTNFGRDIVLDLSTPEKARAAGYIPVTMLNQSAATLTWLAELPDKSLMLEVLNEIVTPFNKYTIPAIELDDETSKSAVTTVFEKVNTGGLALNVFELLTATFAGDREYFKKHGTDFRLVEDWRKTQEALKEYPALSVVKNTDFIQAVSLLATRKRSLEGSNRPITARRDDLLRLQLSDYLEWVEPLREAFRWTGRFLADHHIFEAKFMPYPTQLVPLAAIRVILGNRADLHGVRDRLDQWFWCGIMGELYGSTTETRFARDVEQVPVWALDGSASTPRTVLDSTFAASRFLTLKTRLAAAYKGVYALLMSQGATDWMNRQQFGAVQYSNLAVDIHHIFPVKWCRDNGTDADLADSILNKTPLSASTNRAIGGAAPSKYLVKIESDSDQSPGQVNALLVSHLADPNKMRADDFDGFLRDRLTKLTGLVEEATGKSVQMDLDLNLDGDEGPAAFDPEDPAVTPDPLEEE